MENKMTQQQVKKLDIDSKDIMGENLEKLKKMFPSVIKEGKVDVEALRNVIGDISEPNQEYYNFTWAGKSEAFKIIKEKTTATLKPMKSDDESVDFENTQNIFIEGDNLEVLKILQKTYHNSIKMIYIDPPYNKDKDFVYPDKWSEGLSSYLEYSKLVDEEGNITSSSAEDKSVKAGRKHSRWLTMMYPRLFLARNLLKDDGVIFISIDDDEVKNLRMICDEIFGEENFINNVIWEKKYTVANDAKWFSDNHDHILVYAKNKDIWKPNLLDRTDEMNARYSNPDNHIKGLWKATPLHAKSGSNSNEVFTYTFKNGVVWTPPSGTYPRYSRETLKKYDENDEIWFGKDNQSIPSRKTFLVDLKNKGVVPKTIWKYDEVGHNHEAREELKNIFLGEAYFDTPKPVKLLKRILHLGSDKNDTILDFFAGSGTTAHAVMALNAQDGGNRKCISVQLPEPTDKKSEAYKAGYKKISEITKERIARAGQRIKEENPDSNVDTGFKVFTLSESNFKQWDDTPKSKEELQLAFEEYKDNVKEGSNQLDMLYEVILAKGLSLNSKVQEIDVGSKKMFKVDSNGVELLACFEDEITQGALDEVISLRPIYFICLDSSFKSGSALKTNFVLRFRDADILFETV